MGGAQSPLKSIPQVIGLQDALNARPEGYVGTNAPANPAVGMMWFQPSDTYLVDFAAGQANDPAKFVLYTSGGGSATVSGNRLNLASTALQTAGGVHALAVDKALWATYRHKLNLPSLPDGFWENLMAVRTATARPGSIASGADDCKIMCAMFRSGAAYRIRVMYLNAAGAWRFYNCNSGTYQATQDDYPSALATDYVPEFVVDPGNGTPRWQVVLKSATNAVIFSTPWANFADIQGDATNTYWVELGDRFTDIYGGTAAISYVQKA